MTAESRDRMRWAHDVWRAVDSLDSQQRDLILLRYRHGLDQDGIAVRVGLPRLAVSTIIATGMQRLAHLLLAQDGPAPAATAIP